MPPETRRGLPGSRRGARRHGARGRRRGRAAARATWREAGVDYDDVVRDARGGGRAEVRRIAFDELIEGIEAKRGELAATEVTTERARARRAHLVARPDGLDGQGRGALARLARRAVAHARGRRAAPPARRPTCAEDVDAVVLLGMGGSSLAPEVLRQRVREHDASTCSTPRTRARSATSQAALDLDADAVRLRLEVGLDARDALAHRLLLEARAARRAVGRDHRPGLRARPAGARARLRRPSSPASRRSAAATRRSRRSGSCPRRCSASMSRGCSTGRCEMAEACRLDEGNPGLELGLSLGRGWQDGPRQGLRARTRAASASGSSS